jgi:REP element-mobilizing transposase RayT
MRKPRLEIEGALYHIYSRGNNRQLIFLSDDDYRKFVAQLDRQKRKLPFYLYAYCLMPNHFHLLIERREDFISQIMQRLLTAYSQYHNRKYGKCGHLLQGRYKAILCQSDQYLAELVRYIHLNPVRAKIVASPEDHPYSSHRAYLGLEQSQLVDVEPLLRPFGGTKRLARARFEQFVRAGVNLGHRDEFYRADGGRLLGAEEWITETKNRVGEIPRGARPQFKAESKVDTSALLSAAERLTGLQSIDICGPRKSRSIVVVKEAIIVVGRELGASNADLARLLGIAGSSVSRRYDAGLARMNRSRSAKRLIQRLREEV